MDRHITNRDLAAYLAGAMAPKESERFAGHMAQCIECRKRHDLIRAAMKPRYLRLMPGDAVKANVLRARDKAERDETGRSPVPLWGLLTRYPRLALAGFMAVIGAGIVLGVFLARLPQEPLRLALYADRADVGVTVNNRPAQPREEIYDASTVRLPEKTMARLTYGGLSITLTGPGVFSIDRFVPGNGTGPVRLECTLSDGILVSAMKEGALPMTYSYSTPGARIEPIGTEFLLQASGDNTLVVVKNGRVLVKPARSREPSAVAAGSRCLVTDRASVTPAAPEDMNIFNDLDNLRAGKHAPRLLPPAPRSAPGALDGRPDRPGLLKKIRDRKEPGGFGAAADSKSRRERVERQPRQQIRGNDRLKEKRQVLRETRKAIREKNLDKRRQGGR